MKRDLHLNLDLEALPLVITLGRGNFAVAVGTDGQGVPFMSMMPVPEGAEPGTDTAEAMNGATIGAGAVILRFASPAAVQHHLRMLGEMVSTIPGAPQVAS